jgi:polyisoprenoid-binding protein YceI
MMKKILFAISSAVLISACGGGETAPTAEKPKQDSVKPEVCTYSYDSSATTIGFGAFKFTEKKEVKGGFLKFTVDSTQEAAYPIEVFKKANFKIDVAGLDTKDAGRDFNIKSSFFGKMDSTSFITGRVDVIMVTASDVVVKLKMNNVEKNVALHYTVKDNEITLFGTINLNDFKAQKALASLNTTCKDLHKGSDGKSVTWPEVNIYVSTTLKKNCK